MQQFNLSLNKEYIVDWIDSFDLIENVNNDSKALRIVDLYSGCGGMTLGSLTAAINNNINFEIELALDLDRDAYEVYKDNFDAYSKSLVNNDIKYLFDRRRKSSILDKKYNNVDILMAGPPCQGHSDLNNSTRRNDIRNSLYSYTTKAIEKFDPNFVIIENVSTVIHSIENVVENTKSFLKKKGYFSKEIKINFLCLGIPQTRARHILIASKSQDFLNKINTVNNHEDVPLYDFISEYESGEDQDRLEYKPTNISRTNLERIEYLFDNEKYDLPNELRPSCHKDKNHSYNSCYGRLKYNKPSQTITSGFGSMGQGRYVHPTRHRTLLPIEAARIQGFPKSFSFKKATNLTSLRKMIANAVPPQLTFMLVDFYIQANRSDKKKKRAVIE